MCDTMVALGNATQDGSVIFAKNSDRQPNEPLLTIRVPRKKHSPGEKLKCTYIEIDQAKVTYEVLLLKPSWMWGAEMGANEFGLNIGNEAVFTREKQGPESLLGMDMLRLALERCRTGDQALDLIVELLERYGQGGNCGYEKKFFYHNSFLIADPESAWVLETAGKYWAAQKVKTVRAISNRLSIGRDFDRCHPELIKNARDRGWCKSEADFDFARCYSNRLITYFSGSNRRKNSAECALEKAKGRVTPLTMKKILRSHEPGVEGRQFNRHTLGSVCMHAGFIFGDHTTGSYIAHLNKDSSTYQVTGGSTPCIALYKPFGMIENESFSFSEVQEEQALEFWLKRELLHRAVLENRVSDLQGYLERRNQVEQAIESKISQAAAAGKIVDPGGDNLKTPGPESCRPGGNQPGSTRELPGVLNEIMDYALREEELLLDQTLEQAAGKKGRIRGNLLFRSYWQKQNANLFKRWGLSLERPFMQR